MGRSRGELQKGRVRYQLAARKVNTSLPAPSRMAGRHHNEAGRFPDTLETSASGSTYAAPT